MRTGSYLHLKDNSVRSSYNGRRDGQGRYSHKSLLITGQIEGQKKEAQGLRDGKVLGSMWCPRTNKVKTPWKLSDNHRSQRKSAPVTYLRSSIALALKAGMRWFLELTREERERLSKMTFRMKRTGCFACVMYSIVKISSRAQEMLWTTETVGPQIRCGVMHWKGGCVCTMRAIRMGSEHPARIPTN